MHAKDVSFGMSATFTFPGYNNVRLEARVTVELGEGDEYEANLVQDALDLARADCLWQIQAGLLDQVQRFDWMYGEHTVQQTIRKLEGDGAAETYLAQRAEERRQTKPDPDEDEEPIPF